jgi:hypothetical protein
MHSEGDGVAHRPERVTAALAADQVHSGFALRGEEGRGLATPRNLSFSAIEKGLFASERG